MSATHKIWKWYRIPTVQVLNWFLVCGRGNLWSWVPLINQVGLTTYLLVHLTHPVEWWKNYSLRKLANIDNHRDGTSTSKLTLEWLFLFKMSGFICCLLQFSWRGCGDCVCEVCSVFSVRATKENNGVQKFLIYPDNDSKCAMSRDNV